VKALPNKTSASRLSRQNASALLITLGFILLITVITVAFLVRSRGSLQTTQSYAQEIAAQEIGDLAINQIAGEFQAEIEIINDPDNNLDIILPPRAGVEESNPRNSALVRRTVNGENPGGVTPVPYTNRASAVSADTPAKNGWRFDKARWSKPALLTDAQYNAESVPDWVYVVYGKTSATAATNAEKADVVGRYAAMVYDVGGLLDINEAGSVDETGNVVVLPDKGTVAAADLSALSTDSANFNPSEFLKWRGVPNKGTNGETVENVFYGDPSVTDPTKAGRIESPVAKLSAGENRFLSRMDLIEAAEKGDLGLNKGLLPYFRTRSESANRVSAVDLFADGTSTPVKLTHQSLAATDDRTFTIKRIDGTTDTYTVKKGEPLIQGRFPLARLRLLADREADGTPKHQEEIKKYFGLTWNPTDKIFSYTSGDPESTTPVSSIKTLVQLAKSINGGTVREPDFFEWLKASIDPGSLGQTGGDTYREVGSAAWEESKDLHILRIGANIIDQSDPDSIPTGIRSEFSSVASGPFDSFGSENLPYLNEVITTARREGTKLVGYLQFELWNPYRSFPGHVPVGFDGKPLTKVHVGTLSGKVLMEPRCFFKDRQALDHGKPNVTWSSQNKMILASIDVLSSADFDSTDLSGISFQVDLLASPGFGEPAIATNSGADITNPLSDPDKLNRPVIRAGVQPENLVNAIQIATAPADPPGGFGSKSLSQIYPELVKSDGTAELKDGTILPNTHDFFKPGNPNRAYNAVAFIADGTSAYSVPTSPVTFQLEIETANGARFPMSRYNDLALGRHTGDDALGISNSIWCDIDNTAEATKGTNWETFVSGTTNWISKASDATNSCFANWNKYAIRKGYFMVDARTERLGLAEQIIASPGASILTSDSMWAGSAPWGSNYDMVYSLYGAPGKADQNPNSDTPLSHWMQLQSAGGQYVGVPAALARNYAGNDIATYYYEDSDGTVRRADTGWVERQALPMLPVTAYPDDSTSFPSARNSRPVMLDRPFRSVAELGCVFRDIPWKSLDLFSPDSADRRLLDVFSIEDRPTMTGKINPNIATAETLKALLRGASLDPSDPDSAETVPSGKADAVADEIEGLNPSTPSEEIVSGEKLASILSASGTSKPDGGFSPYKAQTENFLRALSSTTDTRSWQLMLDVVAQSGKIASTGASLNDFVVEGQKRFFVYLTLDRITGEIVDKHVEPVYE